MVSTSPIFQSVIRLSMISIAGSAYAVALITSATDSPGPRSSSASTSAISGSARGCRNRLVWIGASAGYSIGVSRCPKSGSYTPIWSCIAADVSPTLYPMTDAPSAIRRRICSSWIAYASSTVSPS